VCRRAGVLALQAAVLLGSTAIVVELCFRVLELGEKRRTFYEGTGGLWTDDRTWGWKPTPGEFRMGTPEFTVSGSVNDLFMNDAPVDPQEDAGRTRLLVLGDSHTYAIGVSTEETWPKVLEAKLDEAFGARTFRVYNAGESGYSLHQYLLRLIDQGPLLEPHYVVVGLSYATDFYDLLPPDRGGWVYGGDRSRDYFDFDERGELVRRHWEKPADGADRTLARSKPCCFGCGTSPSDRAPGSSSSASPTCRRCTTRSGTPRSAAIRASSARRRSTG
jgi:hypothetical protein